jgi:hypothetical protein
MILKAGRASDRRIQDARPRPRLIPGSARKITSFSIAPLSAGDASAQPRTHYGWIVLKNLKVS